MLIYVCWISLSIVRKISNANAQGGKYMSAISIIFVWVAPVSLCVVACAAFAYSFKLKEVPKQANIFRCVAFGLVLLAAIDLMIAPQLLPNTINDYEVVFSKDDTIVVIDAENGTTKKYDLGKIPHTGDASAYSKDATISVISSCAGRAVLICPSGQMEAEPTE